MESSKAEGKRNMEEAEEDEDEEEEDEDSGIAEYYNKKRAVNFSGRKVTSSSLSIVCQVENCAAEMKDAKAYHRRHKVCEQHSKAGGVDFSGILKRFCQQCSRFHEITEFDENKRSCRRRLAGHNQRRRKSSHDSSGEA